MSYFIYIYVDLSGRIIDVVNYVEIFKVLIFSKKSFNVMFCLEWFLLDWSLYIVLIIFCWLKNYIFNVLLYNEYYK